MSLPELEDPTVFLACPGDVADFVEIVSAELAALRRQVADDQDVKLFSWFDRTEEDGHPTSRKLWLDARFPVQSQIPPPLSPQCRAFICIFGERIGTLLPGDFPLGIIESLKATDETREAWLALNWKPGDAERGGFPLTGTTFEFLSAYADKRVPIFLGFVADETILDPQVPWNKANWGCRRLRKEAFDRYKDDDDALDAWRADHNAHLRQLHNFLHYAKSRVPVQLVGNAEQARKEIRKWLIGALRLRVAETDRDPFKGLEVYDVEDHSVFFGRSTERREAIDRFLERWDDKEKPTAFAIVGGSGVGKSSFLRAGIIGRLRNHSSRDSFIDCVVRPAELLPFQALQEAPEADGASLALRRLFERILEEIRAAWKREGKEPAELAGLAAKAAELSMVQAAHRPAWIVLQLSEALRRLGPGFKLVLGFDQFEEILDQRRDPVRSPFWEPVVELIDHAVRSERIGVLYTLQANRVGLIADDPILSPIWALDGQKNLGFPEQSLGEIIQRSFETTGKIEVDPSLVEALSDRIRTFKNKESGAIQGSLMPLISLTLRRIYERRALPLLAELRSRKEESTVAAPGFAQAAGDEVGDWASARSVAKGAAVVRLTEESCADLLNVEDAIAELAEEAMKEAREASGPDWSDTTLGDLFRRLVDVRGEQYGLPDAVVPSAAALRYLAEALRKRRLLLPADAGRVRLVHEAVLHHWTKAREWLESERPLLDHVASLRQHARYWNERKGRSFEHLRGVGSNDVDQAATVLALWYDILADPVVLADSQDANLLRDYALELLHAHPTPSRIVEETKTKTSHLIIATFYQRTDLVQVYLEQEPESVHIARTDRRTAIFSPCFTGTVEILDLLLAQGAEVDEPDKDGWRPIHLAATAGHVACLSRLRRAGASLEPPGVPAETSLLHLAAQGGHVEMLGYLLEECRLDPSVTNAAGWTPLHFAASFDQGAAVRVLARAGADLEARLADGWAPLHLAAQDRPGAVAALLEEHADSGARLDNGRTPLHVAADHGSAEVIRVLMGHEADPNALTADSEAALHLAAQKGHRTVLPPLLAAGKADVEIRNKDGETPFHVALRSQQWQFATELARLGANVDAFLATTRRTARMDRWTALHKAAWEGDVERATFLVELKADLGAVTPEGLTPFHLAAARSAEAIIDLLLAQGAEPAARSRDGTTAFHLACLAGHRGVAERLAALAPAIDVAAEGEVTPLHLAARRGAREVVELLLERKHPADCADRDGWTPLHLAAQQGSPDVVQLLLASGADCNVVAKTPAMTPLQVAAEVGHTEIADSLLRAGADPTIETAGRVKAVMLAMRHGHFGTVRRLLAQSGAPSDTESLAVASPGLPSLHSVLPAVTLPEEGGGWGNILSYPWVPLPRKEVATLVERANRVDGQFRLNPEAASAVCCEPPWYDGIALYRLCDPDSVPDDLYLCYLKDRSGKLLRLNGTSPPIHEVNANTPIRLAPVNVLDYLRFFCFFVRGEEGPFYVLGDLEDPLLPANPDVHMVLAETIRPARLEGVNEKGHYMCNAMIYYSDAIFGADFAVHPGGMVEMLDDEPIAAGLKSRIDARLT